MSEPPPKALLYVKDFGAVGDGMHDDRAALQSSISAAAAQSAELVFNGGDYLISGQLDIPSNSYLHAAVGTVTLQASTDSVILSAAGSNSVKVEGLTLKGNKAAFRYLMVVYKSYDVVINAVTVRDTQGIGIILSNVNTAVVSNSTFTYIGNTDLTKPIPAGKISNDSPALAFTTDADQLVAYGMSNSVTGSSFNRIGLDGISATRQTNLSITNNTMIDLTSSALWAALPAGGAGIYSSDNHTVTIAANTIHNASGNGIDVNNTSNATITGNTVIGSGEAGISAHTVAAATISGNTTFDNGQWARQDHRGAGIGIDMITDSGLAGGEPAYSTNVTISDNTIGNSAGSTSQPYGIQIADVTPLPTITGNTIVGGGNPLEEVYPDIANANGTITVVAPTPLTLPANNISQSSPIITTPTNADPLVDPVYYGGFGTVGDGSAAAATADYNANGWHLGKSPDAFFDTSYYLARNPDVAAAGVNPLLHYETFGWKEGRNPSAVFDTKDYLAANGDVQAANVDPLLHYIQFGIHEGRPTYLVGSILADPLVVPQYYAQHSNGTFILYPTSNAVAATTSFETTGWLAGLNPNAYFDTKYYLSHNSDVAAAHIDPLLHYETFGWKEGRDPSAVFSTNKYLSANPDVAAAHVDPLLHYIQFGIGEGRPIYPA